ncbi:MAG TPA: DUF1349 domain-containing protein [Phycisphaerae bacterium]|nr:DUF1349 domain-containing protein [Phycisphaerae bacterium]
MNLFSQCKGRRLNEELKWFNAPDCWEFDDNGTLSVQPNPKTDWFATPNEPVIESAGFLYREVEGDFTLSMLIRPTLLRFGDAGALALRVDSALWCKLCMERSPTGETSVVSVVTKGWSDDANGELISRPGCYLRLTRKGCNVGMHYSFDGTTWRFVRCVAMDLPDKVMVGVLAQCPFGADCSVEFSSADLKLEPVQDFRSGE